VILVADDLQVPEEGIITRRWFMEGINWRYCSLAQINWLEAFCKKRLREIYDEKKIWQDNPREKLLKQFKEMKEAILSKPHKTIDDIKDLKEIEKAIKHYSIMETNKYFNEYQLTVDVLKYITNLKRMFPSFFK